MGLFDIFAPKHKLSGDFSLMQGESADIEVYLMSYESVGGVKRKKRSPSRQRRRGLSRAPEGRSSRPLIALSVPQN